MRGMTSPPATLTLTGRRLASTRMVMTMKIKCPHCGSDDFTNFDFDGGIDGEDIAQIYSCLSCDKTFYVIYECVRIEKEDE